MIPIAYNVRNLLVRKTTSAAAALGLGLVVFVFASAVMLSNGVKEATRRAVDPRSAIVLRKGSAAEIESGIDATQVALVGAAPGVARAPDGRPLVVGELIVLVILDKIGKGPSNVQMRGVPDDVMAFRPSVKIVEGRAARPGSDEAIVGRAIRGRFAGLEVGGGLEMRKNRPIRIVGVFEDGGSSYESEIWADTSVLRATFGREGVLSSVRVRLESEAAFDGFKAAVEGNRELGVSAFREAEFADRQTQGTATLLSALGFVIAFLLSIGAVIGAMITMHATVAERHREIGTLRALGFSRVQVLTSFLVESMTLSLVGGAIGTVASLLLSVHRVTMVNTATWAELSFKFEPTPKIVIVAIGVAAAMGLLGGLIPAIRATRVHPAEAMRG